MQTAIIRGDKLPACPVGKLEACRHESHGTFFGVAGLISVVRGQVFTISFFAAKKFSIRQPLLAAKNEIVRI
jgi:hypothetical protein